MYLTACWFHPSCPQGLYTLWLVFVSPCQAAELRVNLNAPTGQHRAGSKVFSVCVTLGGVELRDASVATHCQHLSLWAWVLSALRVMWNTQLFSGLLCRRYSRADGKAMFLMFCHAEGESAICDWFRVCIYTMQLQNVLELMQGITKDGKDSVPSVCEGQQGQSVVQELFREQLPKVLRTKSPQVSLQWLPWLPIAVVLVSLGTELEWPGSAVTSCPDRLWQQLAPPYVLQYFEIFWGFDFFFFILECISIHVHL